jgi:hypothetical protein
MHLVIAAQVPVVVLFDLPAGDRALRAGEKIVTPIEYIQHENLRHHPELSGPHRGGGCTRRGASGAGRSALDGPRGLKAP